MCAKLASPLCLSPWVACSPGDISLSLCMVKPIPLPGPGTALLPMATYSSFFFAGGHSPW